MLFLAFRLAAKEERLRHVRAGKLSVWGDADFVKLCSSSIERLRVLDPDLHRVLTRKSRATVVHDPEGRVSGCDAPPILFTMEKMPPNRALTLGPVRRSRL